MKQFVDLIDTDLMPDTPPTVTLRRRIFDSFYNILFGLIWVLSLILLVMEIT
jgi:hypothetical protein